MDALKARGAYRPQGEPESVTLIFTRRPTDGEMRAIHDALRKPPVPCPFCGEPTYLLPCTACGDPDLPKSAF
jgi:hypothetical protein